MRFDPLTALEGSFRGIPFKVAGDRRQGGQRGPVHEYPDRDLPYFEGLGRGARRFSLRLYFVGPLADLLADRFEDVLWKGQEGPLVLPGFRRERVVGQDWDFVRDVGKANWVEATVSFVESGRNHYPSPEASWSHRLLDAAAAARTAFAGLLADALSLDGLAQEATESLLGGVATLGEVMTVAATIVGGRAPSSALADAAGLVTGYTGAFGPGLDVSTLAVATFDLLGGWADALAGATPDRGSRTRAIDGLWTVHGEAASDTWYAPAALTPLQQAEIANQAALSAGIRRGALTEIARLAARLDFATYDDATDLRARLADAFDDEIDASASTPGAGAVLQDLRAAALSAISAAGADKARLVPYAVARPRPSLALAQLFYADDGDVPARARELAERTGAVHPAFLPARAERLSR
jgi:prophage DNA circulation protein